MEFYVDLGHLTRSEADAMVEQGVPLLKPIKGEKSDLGFQRDDYYVSDPVHALVGSLFVDIRKAMQDSALAELLMEVEAHEDGHHVLKRLEDNKAPPGHRDRTIRVRHRGTTRAYLIKDVALLEMIQSMRYEQKGALW